MDAFSLSSSSKFLLSQLHSINPSITPILHSLLISYLQPLRKKLVHIIHIYTVILSNPILKTPFLSHIINIPVYIPSPNPAFIFPTKQLNLFISQFDITIDYDTKQILSNILYLFIYHIHLSHPSVLLQYIISLIDIYNDDNISFLILQEIILRSILIELSNLHFSSLSFNNIESFFNSIVSLPLKQIIHLSLLTYNNLLLKN